MDILLSKEEGKPLYEKIKEQIIYNILQGKSKEGEGLPSIRVLASNLDISVITVKRAYEELEQEGYIRTIAGKGSYVTLATIEQIRKDHQQEIKQQLSQVVQEAKRRSIDSEVLQRMMDELYEE